MGYSVNRNRATLENYLPHVSVMHRRINFNDPGVYSASTVSGAFQVGALPPGACPLETIVRINTAFTSGHLTLNTTASTSNVVSSSDLAEGSTAVTVVDRIANLAYTTASQMIYANCSSANTAGQADVWIRFLQPRVGP